MRALLVVFVLFLILFSGCTSVELKEIERGITQTEVEETVGNLSTDIIDVGEDLSSIIEDI
jgi:uncharacterized protein YceK